MAEMYPKASLSLELLMGQADNDHTKLQLRVKQWGQKGTVGTQRHCESCSAPGMAVKNARRKRMQKDYGRAANIKQSSSEKELQDHYRNRYLNYIKVIGFDDNWITLWTSELKRYQK
ncbi:hypothetical protein BTVI_20811 [Pitangus sulphuratus]|nr:hypothetical protein BTVI_20811 [Pitangus sulphuratus]